MNTKDRKVRVDFIRKMCGRVLSIQISVVLISGMMPVSTPLIAYAMPYDQDHVNNGVGIHNTSDSSSVQNIKTDAAEGTDAFEGADAAESTDASDNADAVEGTDVSDGMDVRDGLFSIITDAGDNGTVTSSESSIPHGSDRNITAVSDPGYRIR